MSDDVKPADFVLVPRTLTEEMLNVAARIADGPSVSYQEHWDAMLAAADAPSSDGAGGPASVSP